MTTYMNHQFYAGFFLKEKGKSSYSLNYTLERKREYYIATSTWQSTCWLIFFSFWPRFPWKFVLVCVDSDCSTNWEMEYITVRRKHRPYSFSLRSLTELISSKCCDFPGEDGISRSASHFAFPCASCVCQCLFLPLLYVRTDNVWVSESYQIHWYFRVQGCRVLEVRQKRSGALQWPGYG